MRLFPFFETTPSPLVAQSQSRLAAMLDTSATMFREATGCLLDNRPVAVDLKALDDTVNAGEQAVRRSVLGHMAVNPTDDLALGLVLLSVVQDAERCGDLAKSLTKTAALAERPRMGAHVDRLRALRDRVAPQFDRTARALRQSDAGLAAEVMAKHHEVKREVGDVLVALAAASDLDANAAVVLTLAAQHVGRVSSHLSNVASALAMPFDRVRNAPEAVAA